jgi:thymidylate kinase
MALQIVNQLLNDLNSSNINYCHWKSNEHLEAAVNGDTDLDILFDKDQEQRVIKILKRNKFHLFEAVWYRKYKGIVDYIGFDKEAGKIVHVHTHFNLDIGEVGIKSYHLPWEDLILKNRVYNENFNTFISSPETEYLLLVVRTAFKHDIINTKSNKNIARHFNLEAKWLYDRITTEQLSLLASTVLGTEMTELIKTIRVSESHDERLFVSLKKLLKPYFARHRLLSFQRVSYLKIVHNIKRLQIKIGKLFRLPVRVSKRKLPHRGVILCLMGADGAGKSTQTKEITKELSKKIDVLFMYMGSGDGAISFQRKLISNIINFGIRFNSSSKSLSKTSPSKEEPTLKKDISKKSLFRQFILSINAVSLAFEKKNRLKRIDKERKRGGIIICDRYPQTSTLGYNDGPKLYTNIQSSNFILRSFAKYEFSCYKLAKQIYPNLVVKLIGSIEVLHSRRPEMSREEINKKQNGIIDLPFNAPTEVITLDIDKPVCKIKGVILNAISEQINNNQK